jgi:hypothetical protein
MLWILRWPFRQQKIYCYGEVKCWPKTKILSSRNNYFLGASMQVKIQSNAIRKSGQRTKLLSCRFFHFSMTNSTHKTLPLFAKLPKGSLCKFSAIWVRWTSFKSENDFANSRKLRNLNLHSKWSIQTNISFFD